MTPPPSNSNRKTWDWKKGSQGLLTTTTSTLDDTTTLRGSTSFSSSFSSDSDQEEEQKAATMVKSSSVLGAALNFTNSIVGAGCIGYGGAVADSGGFISIVIISVFALLTKASYDLLIDLGLEYQVSSYEDLGSRAAGQWGRGSVVGAKGVFAFGGMVAFMVVVRDNFSSAGQSLMLLLLSWTDSPAQALAQQGSWWMRLLENEIWTTVLLCSLVMLPLSLLRDVAFLERFSSAKILIFGGIVLTVVYLYFTLDLADLEPEPMVASPDSHSFYEKWVMVRPGVIKSMGCFIYGFVAQHTVHLVFRSLPQSSRTMNDWQRVSSIAIGLSSSIFLLLAVFSYMTFWENTSSDLFHEYPTMPLVNCAQILLSLAMLLTFPMNLFSVRELVSPLFQPSAVAALDLQDQERYPTEKDGLLHGMIRDESEGVKHEETRLSWPRHVALTFALWLSSLLLAITPASLGDVLNLIGCIAGALIAFILPAVFAFRLRGYSHIQAILFLVGCFIGCFGTYFGVSWT